MPGPAQSKYNRKRLAALVALIALVVLLIILIVIWFVPQPQTQTPTVTPEPNRPVVVPVTPPTNTVQPDRPKPMTDGELQVSSLARNFAERYGSWSTQSNFQNLKDLYPVVSTRLRSEFERSIAQGQPQQGYRGTTVKALSVTVSDLTLTSANATVLVQQITTDEQLKETQRMRTIDLSFVKQGDFWLVDSATWKE